MKHVQTKFSIITSLVLLNGTKRTKNSISSTMVLDGNSIMQSAT